MPLIGVLPLYEKTSHNYWIKPQYLHGLETAGALPVVLSLTEDAAQWAAMADRLDGFLFTGGQDIAPQCYGEDPLPQCCYAAPPRDRQELALLRLVLDLDKPVLGICRGCQLLNVALGGILYQDLPTQHPSNLFHNQAVQNMARDVVSHAVRIVPGTRLHQILGCETLPVNSLHHQAIRDVADGLTMAATATDGVVEAVESSAHRFALGVQWHPEFLWETHPEMLAIFQALVDACQTR
jgi:putative glutamine amidotransferase